MITTCIPRDDDVSRELDVIKREILGNPELELSIDQMSEKVNISSYHMIRKFSNENGLTPHKFQMQCRIRKAQQLLPSTKNYVKPQKTTLNKREMKILLSSQYQPADHMNSGLRASQAYYSHGSRSHRLYTYHCQSKYP